MTVFFLFDAATMKNVLYLTTSELMSLVYRLQIPPFDSRVSSSMQLTKLMAN